MNPFLPLHRKFRYRVKVKMRVFHPDAADLSAIIGGEIIGQPLCVHTGGVDGAELFFIGAEKPVRLGDCAHKVKES